MRLAMTLATDPIGAGHEIRAGAERRTEADINSGTTPALGFLRRRRV
jgi:hypothetical protein